MSFFKSLFGKAEPSTSELQWPDLPRSGFVSGRVANQSDMDSGAAVFLLANVENATHSDIQVPQFAIYTDGGRKRRVVVVQAQNVPGDTYIGMRDATGQEYVGTPADVELLGQSHP